jgi:predicted acetyltransferase
MIEVRPFSPESDFDAVQRIWIECGWLDAGADKSVVEATREFLSAGPAWVGLLDGEAESIAATMDARIRYLDTELPLSAVTAVTTSRRVRKQGFGRAVTARALREAAASGYAVAALGIFDQGYYDGLGFGTGPYDRLLSVDPSDIAVRGRHRIPIRLGKNDFAEMHAALLARYKKHGAVNILSPAFTRLAVEEPKLGFGLGYREGGELSHFLWAEPKDEHGPYEIYALVYRSFDQLVELFSLIQSLGDQVYAIALREHPWVQLQDILRKPFRRRRQTRNSDFEVRHRAAAYRQYRILDLAACLGTVRSEAPGLDFRLELEDPLDGIPGRPESWISLKGNYRVHLGQGSEVEKLSSGRGDLPAVKCSVAALTRLWMGAASAEWLRAIGRIDCDPELCEELDRAFSVPEPAADLDF